MASSLYNNKVEVGPLGAARLTDESEMGISNNTSRYGANKRVVDKILSKQTQAALRTSGELALFLMIS